MKVEGRKLEDGSMELKYIYTPEELDAVSDYHEKHEAVTEAIGPLFTWPNIPMPGIHKVKYCITGNDGNSQTIEAYGDIHAGQVALKACGGPFQLRCVPC